MVGPKGGHRTVPPPKYATVQGDRNELDCQLVCLIDLKTFLMFLLKIQKTWF